MLWDGVGMHARLMEMDGDLYIKILEEDLQPASIIMANLQVISSPTRQ